MLLPVTADENSSLTKRLQQDLAKFVKAFYFGCKVSIAKPMSESAMLGTGKIGVADGQFNASDMLSYMNQNYMKCQKNTIAATAITEADLGSDYLAFLFGLASPDTSCGCTSIHR